MSLSKRTEENGERDSPFWGSPRETYIKEQGRMSFISLIERLREKLLAKQVLREAQPSLTLIGRLELF
jgi:hypothetical protein